MKKLITLVLALVLCLSMSSALALTAGTYETTVNGMNGPVKLSVVLTETGIESIAVLEHMETPGIGSTAMPMLFDMMIEQQTPNVDTVAGATVTSAVVKNAVKNVLKDAGADAAMLDKK